MQKTTILLREDVKEALEREFGKRQISKVVNEMLFNELISKKIGKQKKMFGTAKWLTKKKIEEVRDHYDRF